MALLSLGYFTMKNGIQIVRSKYYVSTSASLGRNNMPTWQTVRGDKRLGDIALLPLLTIRAAQIGMKSNEDDFNFHQIQLSGQNG